MSKKSLNEFVYPRFWRSKRVIEAMEESRQNTDVLGILAEFDGLEAKWLDNEAYLRARLQFYVDSPAGRQAQFKRDSISRETPNALTLMLSTEPVLIVTMRATSCSSYPTVSFLPE